MAAPTDLSRCFDLSAGITFDDKAGVLYGAADPTMVVPSGTLYVQHGANPALWQYDGAAWIKFGTSALPQYIVDVCTRLIDVTTLNGVIASLATGNALYETVLTWAGKNIEDGDTLSVGGVSWGYAGHYMKGTITAVAYHGDIQTAGNIKIETKTTTDTVALQQSGGIVALSYYVDGVVRIESDGTVADKLFVDLYYKRAL